MGALVEHHNAPTATPKKTLHKQASRQSLTPSNAKSSKTPIPSTTKEVWRPPGKANIPDLLENAFLPACPTAELELRKEDTQNSSGRPPWLPPSSAPGIPQPPPVQRAEQEFEKRIRKAVPKIPMLSGDPKLKYVGFKEIGTGVNGSVVRANMRTNPNVIVAIKRCKVDTDREYRAAILRELRIMSTGHINLIKMREVALWRDEVWMAMDLMRCSVFSVLCKRGIPEEYVVYIARETLKGLTYLHDKGFIHRDVKCENLLLGKNGEVKLADFGLAARNDRVNRDRLGTSKWMAPEVIRELPYDNRVDMWSLGITIIEMMDRVPPHYLIKDEEELFTVILSEPSPTFTYSYPTMYMRGLVAWLLDEDRRTRPGAKDVLMELDAHVQQNLLECSNATDLASFLARVLGKP